MTGRSESDTDMKKKRWLIPLLILLLLAALAAVFLLLPSQPPAPSVQPTAEPTATPEPTAPPEKVTVVAPTCTEAGYTLHESLLDGTIRIVDGEPATGHRFSEGSNVCAVCGYEQPAGIHMGLPRIDLTGSMEGISKDHRITLGFSFADEQQPFTCYSFTTWQGHSSLVYPKKNYTVRLFADEEITEKHRVSFAGWQMEHKYILKANYLDVSQARNLTAARLWGEMAATRPGVHPRLRESSNWGAVNGFPVSVWLNGEFHGLYTMNLHKDEDLYNMFDLRREAVVIANGQTMAESLFRAPAVFAEDTSDWELEYCASQEDEAWAKDSFNQLIDFVMNSDDAAFRAQLHQYLDVDSAIDYLLFLYVTGLEQNAAKDVVMIRYGDSPWIATVYDMECAFGLSPDGTSYLPPETFLPVKTNGVWSSGTDSLLWDRLLQHFEAEIRARYTQLRRGPLNEHSIAAIATGLMDSIPQEYYQQDLSLYPERAVPAGDPREQIESYITQRLPVLDTIWMEDDHTP